jgi:two-component system, OmpR family, KDP operon response regulator KdpE
MTTSVSPHQILIVDDEPQIRRALRLALGANGYAVREAASGAEALDRLAERPPDLVILDLVLPDIDGVEVCRRLREWSRVPVIVLSAHGEDEAKVHALDEGADDYVTKPFSTPELLARMRVALRRVQAADGVEPVIRAGDVEIDLARRLILRGGTEVHLTPTEYALVRTLCQHAGRVITHGQLLRSAIGPGHEDAISLLRFHIVSLRRKLEPDPSQPTLIVTEPGVGYRLRIS